MQRTDKWYFETGKIYDTSYINTCNCIGQFAMIHGDLDDVIEDHMYEIRYEDFDSWIILPCEYTPQEMVAELLSQIQFDLGTVWVQIQPNYVNV